MLTCRFKVYGFVLMCSHLCIECCLHRLLLTSHLCVWNVHIVCKRLTSTTARNMASHLLKSHSCCRKIDADALRLWLLAGSVVCHLCRHIRSESDCPIINMAVFIIDHRWMAICERNGRGKGQKTSHRVLKVKQLAGRAAHQHSWSRFGGYFLPVTPQSLLCRKYT